VPSMNADGIPSTKTRKLIAPAKAGHSGWDRALAQATIRWSSRRFAVEGLLHHDPDRKRREP
jgi:hypothetical protein